MSKSAWEERDDLGRFQPGNTASRRRSAPWSCVGLTRAERRWRAALSRRLLTAGAGDRPWCQARAHEALLARRQLIAITDLPPAEFMPHYGEARRAAELLRQVEEECGGRQP